MNRNAILMLLSAAGVTLAGPLTSDAIAFARAVESGDSMALKRFSSQYPTSPFVAKAVELADNGCSPNWVGGACGSGKSTNQGGGATGSSYSI